MAAQNRKPAGTARHHKQTFGSHHVRHAEFHGLTLWTRSMRFENELVMQLTLSLNAALEPDRAAGTNFEAITVLG